MIWFPLLCNIDSLNRINLDPNLLRYNFFFTYANLKHKHPGYMRIIPTVVTWQMSDIVKCGHLWTGCGQNWAQPKFRQSFFIFITKEECLMIINSYQNMLFIHDYSQQEQVRFLNRSCARCKESGPQMCSIFVELQMSNSKSLDINIEFNFS